ncbi:hypothetical protein SAMN04488112_11977 [Melghirimyces thermohalophilus]|uniref:Uncharacterized protein n=1 Tax=Melghirimyces thermohalophilus TaxID=1236220 RepID=A0A1G6Q437_9BACL|nr:hypothetical protein [Melghirimyces thermohalophilus]SDC87058.1 hypothetical protein SAMN04488112_11977 [Melghirimyces thermohalophilus]
MRWIHNRRVVRFFAFSLLIFYAISLSSPFVGVALADWEPPAPYEPPDDTYIPPDPYEAPEYQQPDPYQAEDPGKREGEENSGSDSQQGDNGDEGQQSDNVVQSPEYKAFKYVVKDLFLGNIGSLSEVDFDISRFNPQAAVIQALRGANGALAGNDFLGKWTTIGLDAWQSVDNAKHVGKFVRSPSEIKAAWQASVAGRSVSSYSNWGRFLENASKPLKVGGDYVARPLKMAGKAAPVLAAVETGISAYEAIQNFSDKGISSTDGWANVGEMMMSGAVVLSASGVGAPVAAGVAVAGAAIWTVSKGIKHWNTVTDTLKMAGNGVKSFVKDPVKTTKKAASAVKDGVSGAVDTVKGWFS